MNSELLLCFVSELNVLHRSISFVHSYSQSLNEQCGLLCSRNYTSVLALQYVTQSRPLNKKSRRSGLGLEVSQSHSRTERSVFSLTARGLIYSSSALSSPPSARHFPAWYLHRDYHKSVSGEVRTGHRVAPVTYGPHKSPQRSQREQMDENAASEKDSCWLRKRGKSSDNNHHQRKRI